MDQLNIGSNQMSAPRNQRQARHRRGDRACRKIRVADQEIVGTEPGRLPIAFPPHPKPARGVCLRVAIEQKHLPPFNRQAGCQVDSRGGFAHAAFLVDDRQDAAAT